MTPEQTAALPYVNSLFNYVSAEERRPAYYLYEIDTNTTQPLPKMDKTEMPVHDCRAVADQCSLDREGFSFTQFEPKIEDFYDDVVVRRDYYPQVEAAVKAQTGAARVVVFDHNVRHDPLAESQTKEVARPVRFVHNDYTETSGPQRVRDILGKTEANKLLRHRFAVINLWRPISGPVYDMPLGIIDASSMVAADFVATDLKYKDRTGEVSSVRHNSAHRWFYFANMRADEALFLKCFDSDISGRARYTAHSAFADPTSPTDAPARESIEARALVFFR